MIITKILPAAFAVLISMGAASCFSEVESTKKINADEVRKSRATETPEQKYLSDIRPVPPAMWEKGRRFRVADKRIDRIFPTSSINTEELEGTDIIFAGFSRTGSLTGNNGVEVNFTTGSGQLLSYTLPAMNFDRLDTLKSLDIPFTVDIETVERIDREMKGKHFYIKTPLWYTTEERTPLKGLRHINVLIDSVIPGDDNFPAAVCFTVTDPDAESISNVKNGMVLMSIGKSLAASRNFDKLFNFSNPRRQYPEIKDDTWKLIISSKVREGMSVEECRLALGTPPQVLRTPTYGGMREQWSYSDGVFLIFDDGFLSRYRL